MKLIKKTFQTLTREDIAAWKLLTHVNTQFDSAFYQYDFSKTLVKSGVYVDVVIGYHENEVKLVLPIQYESSFKKILGLSSKLGGHLSDYAGAIIADDLAETISIKQLPLHYVMLDHVPVIFKQLIPQVEMTLQNNSSKICLGENTECYLKQLKSDYLIDIQLAEKKLESKLGVLSFTIDTELNAYHKFFEELDSAYQQKQIKSPFSSQWTKSFLEEVLQLKDKNLTPVLSSISVGNVWLASQFGIKSNGVLHYWFHLENKEMHEYYPAEQLLIQVIKSAQAQKITCIDLGFGQSKNRQTLCNQLDPLYKCAIVNSSFKGWLCRLIESIRWRFARFTQ